MRDPGSQCNNLLIFLKQFAQFFNLCQAACCFDPNVLFKGFFLCSDDIVLDIVDLLFILTQVPVPDIPGQLGADEPPGGEIV